MIVVCDIETERLDDPQTIWLIVCKEVDTGKVHVFRRPQQNPKPFLDFASRCTGFVGHNFISFDLRVLRRLLDLKVPDESILDTLVVSRLLNTNIEGGHSLEAWGQRLGYPKISFNNFSEFTQEMEDYCLQDVETNYQLFLKFKPYIYSNIWKKALRLEHNMAFVCEDMKANGFSFNTTKAEELSKDIYLKVQALENELQAAFPPRSRLIREVTPRATKHGTLHRQDFRWLESGDLTPFSVGSSFSLIEFVPFNPRSPTQVVERMNEAGWKPFEKTKGHIVAEREADFEKLKHYEEYGWRVTEANLNTLPKDAPEASRKLVEYLTLSNRYSVLTEWLNAVVRPSNRIHGTFNAIGAWTHRMSHASPNMANIPSGDSLYAHEFRSLWTVPDDRLLVGVDADGIQLRVLAHYINDERFTASLVSGDKALGTDPHTLNMKALGYVCKDRDTAKTFIYAWLLGAAAPKIAQILRCSVSEAKQAMANFLEAYPGLKQLKKKQIPRDAKRGYFEGFDGRLVLCDSEHLMLAGYLQNGEATIMKTANLIWRKKLRDLGIPFRQVNFVHDEWQTEVPNDMALAEQVAAIQADAIREAGEVLNLRCPMAGSIMNTHKKLAIGRTWSETH